MKKNKMINKAEPIYMSLFYMIMQYFLIVLVLFSVFKIMNFNHCLGLIQCLAFSIPIMVYLITKKDVDKLKEKLTIIASFLCLFLVIPFIYSWTYDLTIDGNSYHKTAIAFLKEGWNPIYESSLDFQKKNVNIVKFDKKTRIDLWVDHYPKGSWIIAAVMYDMTGSIESGKCLSLILAIAMVMLAYKLLSSFMNRKISFLISVFLALNPIIINQLFTYYVDGLMGICFSIELMLLITMKIKEKTNWNHWIALTAIASVFVNLKFTGLLCSGVIAAVYYFYWVIVNRKEKNYKQLFIRITLLFTMVFSISLFIVGSNSYIINTIQHHNPLYPLIGKGKVDIITTMQPEVFNKTNNVKKFFWSMFSKTENVTYYSGEEPELKIPFMIYKSELANLSIPDMRIAGFGPWFALSFVIGIVLLLISSIKILIHEKDKISFMLLPILAIIISIVLVGEGWWARYVPQLYLIPILSIISTIYTLKYWNKNIIFKCTVGLLIMIMSINIMFYLKTDIDEIKSFRTITNDLNELSKKDVNYLKLSDSGLYGYYYNLKDRNINYVIVDELIDNTYSYKYSWRLEVVTDEELYKAN